VFVLELARAVFCCQWTSHSPSYDNVWDHLLVYRRTTRCWLWFYTRRDSPFALSVPVGFPMLGFMWHSTDLEFFAITGEYEGEYTRWTPTDKWFRQVIVSGIQIDVLTVSRNPVILQEYQEEIFDGRIENPPWDSIRPQTILLWGYFHRMRSLKSPVWQQSRIHTRSLPMTTPRSLLYTGPVVLYENTFLPLPAFYRYTTVYLSGTKNIWCNILGGKNSLIQNWLNPSVYNLRLNCSKECEFIMDTRFNTTTVRWSMCHPWEQKSLINLGPNSYKIQWISSGTVYGLSKSCSNPVVQVLFKFCSWTCSNPLVKVLFKLCQFLEQVHEQFMPLLIDKFLWLVTSGSSLCFLIHVLYVFVF
jgi:hypothetical protein